MAFSQVTATVTGLGATTPLGGTAAATWEAMLAGVSGASALTDEWALDLPSRLAAKVKVEPGEVLDRVRARKLDRCQQLALIAAREAWADAGAPEVAPERLAVVIGTGIGGMQTLLQQDDLLEATGSSRKISPHTVPMMMANGSAGQVSIELGARGGAFTPVSACASGAEALAMALDLIRLGRADVVIAGGTEALVHRTPLAAFAQAKTLSTRNEDPTRASRPFDAGRDGLVLGEGAALLVLESPEFAAARGARPLAGLAGSGITSDAYHITAGSREGQVRAIRMALESASVTPQQIDLVHAHATSTELGDLTEAESITEAIGTHPAVTATKSMTGHLLGGSGALGALATVLALRDGIAPATLNLEEQDPRIKLDVVTGAPRAGAYRTALANSFGFGGHNVSLVFTAVD
ncbi:beta-ketoacyl-[acyl-carrier-protein] synthase family protein [Kitasatospora viridis]|uniref:3-oxoacyl-[acyl-carrier-protein] synthase II n=1 Tax=Kitasatospora viridis TaxID=281105 RepID=A0A561SG65_9ACTN|nr:beta-ketoacyl-ACP synthase II [Kitasatospora viridis]TWF73862.1 3-oxoacyl-[acyl-carrier-protein] synthase II [Kitasatospora viridis]